MPAVISVEGVTVDFATGLGRPPLRALHGLDLDVHRGEIVGVLGPNGAGKTTALRVISGVQRPTAGTARVLDLAPHAPELRTRVGHQPTGALPFPSLRGLEFLRYMGHLMRMPGATIERNARARLDQLQIAGTDRTLIRNYSTGMRRRLALATALLADPEVLLLDEPTAGLDPEGTLLVLQVLEERAAAGCAILMASHHLQEVEQLCKRVYMFHGGRVIQEGSLDALLGTDATTLVVKGLDEDALAQLTARIAADGGTVVERSRHREHLNAYYRRRLRSDGGEA